MAFESLSYLNTPSPILNIVVGSWSASLIVNSPIVASDLNSYIIETNIITPVFNLSWNVTQAYEVSSVLPAPSISGTGTQSVVFSTNQILKTPSITASLLIPNTYSTNIITNNPIISASFSAVFGGQIAIVISKPLFNVAGIFTENTISKQTWVLNTITGAHSRYTNYNFNSYFKLGSKNYGVSSTGIYEITGNLDYADEDNESLISAQIDLPVSAFGVQQLKACSNGILYARCDGDLDIITVTEEQQKRSGVRLNFDYKEGMHRKRAKIPKGLKGTTWQFILKNVDGSNFDINYFEVILATLKRIQ